MYTYLYTILFFITISNTTIAQLTLNTTGVDNYSVSLTEYNANTGQTQTAALGLTERPFSPTNPGNLVWYEFGDGGFTFKPQFTHGYSSTPQNSLLKITGIYQGGGKPTRILSGAGFNTSGAIANNYIDEANDPLTTNYNVRVTSNINAIKMKDTMHFAIDYRVPTDDPSWKLVFEYNENGIKHFIHTNSNFKIIDGSVVLPFIRVHNGETVTVSNTANRIDFTNLGAARRRRTVFVSLIGNNDTNLEGLESSIRAYLINSKETRPSKANEDVSRLGNIGNRPYDPNYIKVDKHCITPNTLNKELNYHIHFQNTGIGHADDVVIVSAKLPINISPLQFAPISAQLQINSATFPMQSFAPFVLHNTTNFTAGVAYYDITTHTDSIHFLIKQPSPTGNIILNGMDSAMANFMNDTRTMGDIKYKIRLPAYNPPKNLISIASIIFDTEAPVNTDPAITKVRRHCGYRQRADCNCTGIRKGFITWLKERCE